MNKRQLMNWKCWAAGLAVCGLLLVTGTALAQNADYDRGRAALDKREWKVAARAFGDASAEGRDDADAALYWQAYALDKLDQTARAQGALDELLRRYPDSRWIDDAELLRRELDGGHAEATANEEIKLAALMALTHSDPDRALPHLRRFLDGPYSSDSKEHALFLLMQTGSDAAMDVVVELVRGGNSTDLRVGAIHSLALANDPAAYDLLDEVYGDTDDLEVKEAILEAYMISGQQAAILSVVRNESNDELRGDAISLLGAMGAVDALGELYDQNSSREFREALLEAFMISGDKERILAAARDDSDPELRAEAVQFLGIMGGMEELWEMYGRESDLEVKQAILEGLAIGGGASYLKRVAMSNDPVELRAAAVEGLAITGETSADELIEIYTGADDEDLAEAALGAMMMGGHVKAMIGIARQEKNPERKREIIQYLAMSGSAEATEYMLELLDD